MIATIKEFANDVSKEMKKVSWPTKEQLRESTVVVLATCLIITIYVFIIDQVMTFIMDWVY